MSSPFWFWKRLREGQEKLDREAEERIKERERQEREKAQQRNPPKTPPQSR